MTKKIYIFLFAAALLSCNGKDEQAGDSNPLYFDIKGFFENEITRMSKLNPVVDKVVEINGTVERKTIKVSDWKKEFTIFLNADINKASWRGSFTVVKKDSAEVFTSDNKKIPIKSIQVDKIGSGVKKIEIVIANKNILFQSNDTLVYFPDSLYRIKKQQKIRLLSEKTYQITGKIK